MLLAQLSDLHVGCPGTTMHDRFRTHEGVQRAVARVVAHQPGVDAVLITGDLVDFGSAAEYEHLRTLLAPLSVPVFVVPGNHDDRDALRAAFAEPGYLPTDGFLCYRVALGPIDLICLDTHVPGAPGGLLCPERLSWLDGELRADPDRPAIVALHHPPFRSGIAAMDAMGLTGSEQLAEVIAGHPRVQRIVCGHLHRFITTGVAHTTAISCASTAQQIELCLAGTRLAVVDEPPAFLLHSWDANRLTSHVCFLDVPPATLVISD